MFLQFRPVEGRGKGNVIHMMYREGDVDKAEPVKSFEHFIETLRRIGHDGKNVGISSTLDFPEEYTKDPEQLKLCERLTT